MSEFREHTDSQLVAGVLDGDRGAFAAMYDRYANRLFDFCHAVLRDRDEAADAVQDTFVLVAGRLAQLNDPDRLRPWLYAVARSVALRQVRTRKRVVLDEVADTADVGPGPDDAAEQVALRELVWSAAAGLSERDRALLDLHVRQGLDGAELGEAMGVPANHAYVLLTRLRDQVERAIGALLVARKGRAECPELDDLLSSWDGRYSPLMRKRVARHVDGCVVCAERRRVMVSPLALLATVPLLPAPLLLRDRVLDEVELVAHESTSPPGAITRAPRRRLRVSAAAAAVLALLAAGGAVAYWRGTPVPGEPVALDITTTTATTRRPTTTATSTTSVPTSVAPTTTTTTTTRDPAIPPVEPPPPPPEPPDPPDPPADTTAPAISDATVSNPRLFTVNCREPRQATVSAAVTDNVGVSSVTVRWTGPDGSGTTAMTQRGGRWHGTLGPFRSAGSVEWTIAATDAAGNQAVSAADKISVSGCPIG